MSLPMNEDRSIMGTPQDAHDLLAQRARAWRELRQPRMDTAAGHKKHDAAEREARFQLANAALFWLWHVEHPEPALSPAPAVQGGDAVRRPGLNIGGLTLLAKTNSKRTINLAAYHSPHSLTWSWILSVSFSGAWRKLDGKLRFAVSPWRTNCGGQWMLVFPFVALQWHRQREMWFRDMYNRAREREEALERQASRLRRELRAAQEAAALAAQGRAH